MRSVFVQALLGALILAGGFTAELRAQAKKNATVTFGNMRFIYDGSPKPASASTSATGFNSYKFTYKGSSLAPTDAGSYSVVCTLVNDKFEGRATGTLVIAKASATILLGGLSQTYNGFSRPATATSSAREPKIQITYDGSSAPTNVGRYTVLAKETNPNYQGSATGTLVIAKGMAAVSLADLSQTFNGLPRSAKATSIATGISSFDITYNGSPNAPTAPGGYSVAAKLMNANYQGNATGTLVVAKAGSTTALTLAPTKANVGTMVTLTATVKPTLNGVLPSGKVTLKDGNKVIEEVTLANNDGVATATFRFKLTAANHAFTAHYAGDANFAVSASPVTP